MNPLGDIDIFELDGMEGLFDNTNMINAPKDLRTIEIADRQYHILKRTGVMLMPRGQKFKCQNKEDLILALKIEKVGDRFQNDMELIRFNETGLFNTYTKPNFLDDIIDLAVRDFKVGNEREDIVIAGLESKNGAVAPYSDKTAYSNEGKGIDIVCSRNGEVRNIQVKSGGFGNHPIVSQTKQLRKMVTNNCFLAIVDQRHKNRLTMYSPVEVKEWLDTNERSQNG